MAAVCSRRACCIDLLQSRKRGSPRLSEKGASKPHDGPDVSPLLPAQHLPPASPD
eukprot:CAMPEP_0179973218 /NCGR_PEP_ID=MMETSP0983-20121128/37246_1 /TAXON_ID=483367 /ORGANISM="non described non described, Strain CCMP 2436" /LENGTH=54 /DNA_ID=CAMNT_0021888999 /DNA_START=88 /DNA_END=249 /DNA_ORIENTATION=-